MITQHWLDAATRVPSPNHSERPDSSDISLLVIHNISLPPGDFGGTWIHDLFCNQLDASRHPYFADICTLRVSAHLLIRRDGALVQYVPFDKKAWHAGQSCFDGRTECNDFSIGIELEGTDEVPFTPAQYASLVSVTRTLLEHYPGISRERIAGHSDIAKGRKTDPGPCFDWQYYLSALTLNECPPTLQESNG